jgi:hypothetical protein
MTFKLETDLWVNELSYGIWIRFGTWDIRSLHRAGSLMTVSKELSEYKSDSVGVQEVRWDGGGTKPHFST